MTQSFILEYKNYSDFNKGITLYNGELIGYNCYHNISMTIKMKFHYFNILLFSHPLNILLTSCHINIQKNPYITTHTPNISTIFSKIRNKEYSMNESNLKKKSKSISRLMNKFLPATLDGHILTRVISANNFKDMSILGNVVDMEYNTMFDARGSISTMFIAGKQRSSNTNAVAESTCVDGVKIGAKNAASYNLYIAISY
ncbi:rifin PIR protein,putative [Plasmodium sp.]|nr:rifin PIR protein,putative [Plasmodium sp.]